MHGNRPQPGGADVEPTPEHRRALRRDLLAVASSTRELLADDFVVGAEISEGDGALSATVAVQPPAGSVVSAGFEYEADDAEADPRSLAHDLVAGAVLEAKHAAQDVDRAAR